MKNGYEITTKKVCRMLVLIVLSALSACGWFGDTQTSVVQNESGKDVPVSELGISFFKVWTVDGKRYAAGAFSDAGNRLLPDWSVVEIDKKAHPVAESLFRDAKGGSLFVMAASGTELLVQDSELKLMRYDARSRQKIADIPFSSDLDNCTLLTGKVTGHYWLLDVVCPETNKTLVIPLAAGGTTVLPSSCSGAIVENTLICANKSTDKGTVEITKYDLDSFAVAGSTSATLEDVRSVLALDASSILIASRTELLQIDANLQEKGRRDLASELGYVRSMTGAGADIWVSGSDATLLVNTADLSTVAKAAFAAIDLEPVPNQPRSAIAAFGASGVQILQVDGKEIVAASGYRRTWAKNAFGEFVLSVDTW